MSGLPQGEGIMKWWPVSVCLSVCLSVACLNLTREQKGPEPKIGEVEAHHTINRWTYLEVKRSKVKVTRPINAVTDNAPYAGQKRYNFLKICLLTIDS